MSTPTSEQFPTLQALIMQRYRRLTKEHDTKTAYRLACDEAGRLFDPPLSAEDMSAWLAQERVRCRKAAPPDPSRPLSRYRSWCEQNDFVPRDALLLHFTDHAASTWAGIRRALRQEGYEFEEMKQGWRVFRPGALRPKLLPVPKQQPLLEPAEAEVIHIVPRAQDRRERIMLALERMLQELE